MTRAATLFLLVSVLAFGCTKTVYVIQNPDGTTSEVTPAEAEVALAPGEVREVTLVTNPDGTVSVLDAGEKLPPGTEVLVEGGVENPDGTIVVDIDPSIELPDELVIVDVASSNDYIQVDEGGPLYLQVTLGARELVGTSRAPLNLALVIDRSGSMSGRKIEDVKAASIWLVDNLLNGDRVAIVSYASDVRVDAAGTIGAEESPRLIRAIQMLSDGGGTFLSGGLETGASQVSEALDPERLNRVILLSDGNANEGVTDPFSLGRMADQIRERGISVSTMGVGVDYNEDIMEEVAIAGGGNYYFIESSSAVATVFGREIDNLGTTIVRDAELILELPTEVVVDDVYGYKYEQIGNELTVFMNSVSSGQERRLLMALNVPKKHSGDLTVATGRISYRDEIHHKNVEQVLAPVTVKYTKDARQVSENLDAGVVEKLEVVRNAQVKRDIYQRIDSGDLKGAQGIIANRKAEATRIMAQVDSPALDAEFDELERLDVELKAVPEEAEEQRVYRSSRKYKKSKKKDKAAASSGILF